MTTASAAFATMRSRIEGGGFSVPLHWPNQDKDSTGESELPDVPVSRALIKFNTDRGYLAAFGGGQNANLWRNQGLLEVYCFVPRGDGIALATDLAETFATLFRGFRDANISCFDATVRPGTSSSNLNLSALNQETQSVADNYFWAVAQVSFHYDQIG